MKRKVIEKTILGIAIILVILLLSADIYVMLYGGEYLAESILPPLPEDRIKVSDGCLIGSSDKCRAINYMRGVHNYFPEMEARFNAKFSAETSNHQAN